MIPKAELHCHLEGSVPPELARELAARYGLDLPANLFDADGHYIWRDFLSFLDAYDRVCGVLRGLIEELYDEATAEAVRIQYGGSMKPDNALELLAQTHIDGGLIGGASLKAADFAAIVRAAAGASN